MIYKSIDLNTGFIQPFFLLPLVFYAHPLKTEAILLMKPPFLLFSEAFELVFCSCLTVIVFPGFPVII